MAYKINTFSRPALADLRKAMDEKLAELGKDWGITLSIGTLSFTDNECSGRLTMTAVRPMICEQMKTRTIYRISFFDADNIRRKIIWLT